MRSGPHGSVRSRVEAALGERVLGSTPLGGGSIARIERCALDSGRRIVVKSGVRSDAGLDIEGRMLVYLAERTRLPVPRVLHAQRDLLVMEFIESGGAAGAGAERHAADLLGALHALSPGAMGEPGAFGFAFDTLIGGLHQPNPWCVSWTEFFARRRLFEMARQAHEAGRLSSAVVGRIERLAGRLDRWIAEPVRPALIHGDVWSGNVLVRGGRIAAFIDPAVYFADPEVELAFITLFGTFGPVFFDRYGEHHPIGEGFFEQRRHLYNLYPLLVHTRLFGGGVGGYAAQVESVLSRFGV